MGRRTAGSRYGLSGSSRPPINKTNLLKSLFISQSRSAADTSKGGAKEESMVRGVVGAGGAAATLLFLFIVSTVALPLTVRWAPTVDFIDITNGPNSTGSRRARRHYILPDTETVWNARYKRT